MFAEIADLLYSGTIEKGSFRSEVTIGMFPVSFKKLEHGKDSWSADVKSRTQTEEQMQLGSMRSMLNKLTDRTLDKFVTSTKELNYESSEMVELIFNKIVSEPKNTELYVNFCDRVYSDITIFSEKCLEQFKNSHEQLRLCPFIGLLYSRGTIRDLQPYIELIFKTPDGSSVSEDRIILISTLLKNILTFNKKINKSNAPLYIIIEDLIEIKTEYSSRCRFLIEDLEIVIKGKIG